MNKIKMDTCIIRCSWIHLHVDVNLAAMGVK